MQPSQPPMPQGWNPVPASPHIPPNVLVWAVLATVMAIGFLVVAGFLLGGMAAFGGIFIGFLCLPLFFIVAVVIIVIVTSTMARRRTIPPPPPIQQRMVPAGQQGPVALDCPNCGGPPTNVDRFGIATCAYCGTRFLVR